MIVDASMSKELFHYLQVSWEHTIDKFFLQQGYIPARHQEPEDYTSGWAGTALYRKPDNGEIRLLVLVQKIGLREYVILANEK